MISQNGKHFGISSEHEKYFINCFKIFKVSQRLKVFEKIFSWTILKKSTILFCVVEVFGNILEILLF